MFYESLNCTTCGRDKICVVISTYDAKDPMRVPRLEPHCTECLHDTCLELEDGIINERLSKIHRIK